MSSKIINAFEFVIQNHPEFLIWTKTLSTIRDDFLKMSSKKNPQNFFYNCCKDYPKLSVSFSELYIQNYPGFTTMEWRCTMDSSDSWPCRVFLHICVTLLPTPKKKCGHRKVSYQPNDNNITQNKGSNFIHHSIIYCEERDKIKTHPVHRMIYLNKRLWALYQQKSCNIACPAEITIHIQIPMRFPSDSLLLSLSLTYSS